MPRSTRTGSRKVKQRGMVGDHWGSVHPEHQERVARDITGVGSCRRCHCEPLLEWSLPSSVSLQPGEAVKNRGRSVRGRPRHRRKFSHLALFPCGLKKGRLVRGGSHLPTTSSSHRAPQNNSSSAARPCFSARDVYF